MKKGATAALVVVVLGLMAYLLLRPRVSFYSVQVPRQSTPQKTGPAAPAFSLAGLDGKTVQSADYAGKVVLVDFWATWCTPCRAEIPRFVALQDKYRDRGFQVIGISMDDEADPARAFAREFKMNYPICLGDTKTADAFGGVLGLPTNVLIGRDGHIHSRKVGATDLDELEEEIKSLL